MKLKNLLTEAESFTATNKKTGKTSVFKSKDTRDAAIKAGTHSKIKKGKEAGSAQTGGTNIFGKPAADAKSGKDDKSKTPTMKHTKVGEDSLEVKTISNFTNLRAKALADFINKNKLDATAIANFVKKGSLRDRMDIGTAIVGNPGNKYEKKVIKQFGSKEEEPKKDEPKSEPKKLRQGNPQVNKATKSKAEKLGITPEKLGKEEYQKKMAQAAYEALTDSNYHTEARELIAKLEGKPEMAERPEYPSMKDPKFDEKMAAIRTKYASEYSDNVDDDARELGISASQEAGWGGVEAADSIAFTLRMNGFHKLADTIQSVFDNKGYMKNESLSLKKMIKK